MMIAIDQYGMPHRIKGVHPRKELMEAFDCKHAEKMYVDKSDGTTVHVGYIINGFWLALYAPVEKKAGPVGERYFPKGGK